MLIAKRDRVEVLAEGYTASGATVSVTNGGTATTEPPGHRRESMLGTDTVVRRGPSYDRTMNAHLPSGDGRLRFPCRAARCSFEQQRVKIA